jgi:hypothetical protein
MEIEDSPCAVHLSLKGESVFRFRFSVRIRCILAIFGRQPLRRHMRRCGVQEEQMMIRLMKSAIDAETSFGLPVS